MFLLISFVATVNEFVRRQQPNTGKTYSTLSFEQIAKHAEEQLQLKRFAKGYRDGVIIIPVSNEYIKHFMCPFVKINSQTKLKAEVVKRRPEEEYYIRIKAIDGNILEIENVDLILYRNDVLKETNENTTDSQWELISFHAIPKGINKLPIGPVTMMRNQLQLKGGTKGVYSSEEWAKSVYFWQNYALKG